MNIHAMLQMAGILAAAAIFASVSVYLIEKKSVHPAWIVGVLFGAAIIAVGLL